MKGALCAWAIPMALGNEIPVVILLDHFILEIPWVKKHEGLTQTNSVQFDLLYFALWLAVIFNNNQGECAKATFDTNI